MSTAPVGINGEGETWKELDQGSTEGLTHGGAGSGRWPLGLLVPEKLLGHAGGKLQPGRSEEVKQQSPLPGKCS